MAFTRANFEATLVAKLGKKLAFVGKSLVTDGTNPDLALPMANAVVALNVAASPPRLIGNTLYAGIPYAGGPYSVADFGNITDADLANVPANRMSVVIGLGELFTLEDIWGCMTDVTESIGGGAGRSQSWSSMSQEMVTRIGQLQERYAPFLAILRPLSTGTIKIPYVRPQGAEL